MSVFSVLEGNGPVILTQPHGGTYVPTDILEKFNERGKALVDTDWHINKLYDGLLDDVTIVQSHVHRYVIDANRDPDDVSLYPGQNTTSLCPLSDFDGNPIYKQYQEPSSDEIEHRRLKYYGPYHAALSQQIERLKLKHKAVVIYDCHSIRSKIPFLFKGTLPDFNIGTNGGQSCNAVFQDCVEKICRNSTAYTSVVNGRFKGGWTVRHYGQPERSVHAIQMELAQTTYMQESAPWTYDKKKAEKLRERLNQIIVELCQSVVFNAVSSKK